MLSFNTALAALVLASYSVHAAPLNERGTGFSQSENLEKRGSATTTATVAATSAVSAGTYLSPIQINGVTYNVQFDTGSGPLWVKGSGGTGPFMNMTYGSGWAAGNMAYGTLTIGGITLTNQSYLLASSTGGSETSIDGVLGLRSYPTQFSSSYSSVMSNLMPLLNQQWIGVDLAPSSLSASGSLVEGVGEFAFGWADTAHAGANIQCNPVNASFPNAWFMTVSSFGVPTGDTSIACDLDTGTTNTYVPMSVAAGYWSQVPSATTTGNGVWTFPCNATLPNFSPVIAGSAATVPGQYSTYPNNGQGSSTCTSRLRGTSNGCTLGQSFFMGQYVLYDFSKKAIGLAPRK